MEKYEMQHKREALEDVVPRSAPFVVFIDPCGACNFKCNFCPCNISDYQAAERHKMMSWELFEKIVEDLKEFQGQVKVINLHGYGEPLLNPRIADMVKTLKANHCCRDVRITTNASLLDEEKSCALIDAGVDQIRISVEALSTQGYKELCGVDMEFSKIYENVKRFYELSRGTRSKIAVKIVSAELKTKEDQQSFFDWFAPISDYHYIEDICACWVDFQEIKMPAGNLKTRSLTYQENEAKHICSFPFTDMSIHSNGIVSGCCEDWKFALQYGDVKKQRLSEIWRGREHYEFQCAHLMRNLRKKFPICHACTRKTPDEIKDAKLILSNLEKRFDGDFVKE